MKDKIDYFEKQGVKFKRITTYDDEGLYQIKIYWTHQGQEGLVSTMTRQD